LSAQTVALKLTVDPEALRRRSQRALQHIIDCSRISVSSLSLATPAAYEAPPTFIALDTAANESLDFDVAREAAAAWHVRNAFRDAVEVVAEVLEEARRICAVATLGSGRLIKAHDLSVHVNGDDGKFHRLGLPDRLDHLSSRYGLAPNLSEHFLSLNRARNCLVHRRGVVGARDVDGTGSLSVTFRAVRPVVIAPSGERVVSFPFTIEEEGSSLGVRVVDEIRSFPLGSQVQFSPEDLHSCLLTILLFSQAVSAEVRRFVGQNLSSDGVQPTAV
jgi:uncharacterized protein YutE (UPF0331/DUF86 family)